MIAAVALAALILGQTDASAAALPPLAAFEALGPDAVQDVVVLAETRLILLRFRVLIGARSSREASNRAATEIHASLDRDGDGKLTVAEAAANGLALFLPPAPPRGEVDTSPQDGLISTDELAGALGKAAPALRVQPDGLTDRRTDALFDHLDRDKDGLLTRPELAAIVGTLRKLDRDDNELIEVAEVAVAAGTTELTTAALGRTGRDAGGPAALAIEPGESPLRVIRVLLKKYDVESSRGPGKTDSRLSPAEFAIPAPAFAAADRNGDQTLNSDELRQYLAQSPIDATVDVALAAEPTGQAAVRITPTASGISAALTVRPLAGNVVEIDLGLIRLDLHVDDGLTALAATHRAFRARFDAADANKDDYLEEAELTQDNGQPSPLAGLFPLLDLNHDGKLYFPELDLYVDRQAVAARSRLTLIASNQGRALFGLLDRDRDRRLGAREVLDTLTRIMTCDRDRDGRVGPDEIPHHIQLTLTRGELAGLLATPVVSPAIVSNRTATPAAPLQSVTGPAWFRRMDRNHDGDVSRREFLGTNAQYDRLDRDGDGLLGPAEAEAARPVKGPGG